MIARIATALLCTAAPVALLAQEVDLRSPDEFISVSGEIVGYNGVMLRVETLVGTISVPASEVICYGEGCLEVLASNDFGLSETDLAGVQAGGDEADIQTAAATGDLTVGFANAANAAIYNALAETYAASGEGAALSEAAEGDTADINLETVALNGSGDVAYTGPSGWSGPNSAMSHQLLGVDGLTVQIAQNVGLDQISIADLGRVFSGEVTNWSQIGGADLAVLGLRLPDTAPLQQQINALILAPQGLSMANGILAMGDERGIAASVNQFPGSISIVSSDAANPDLAVPIVGSCGIAVSNTPFNVLSGDYPLVRPVMATYAAGQTTGPAVGLFDFAATDAGQAAMAQVGLPDFSAVKQGGMEKNARLNGLLNATLDDDQRVAAAQMFQQLLSMDRLSTTFFGGAVTGPQAAWNRAMMRDLRDAAASGDYAGRELVFVGFAESGGESRAAIAASVQAASDMGAAFEAAAGSALAAGDVNVATLGFGNIALTSCIDGPDDAAPATRVEVWLR